MNSGMMLSKLYFFFFFVVLLQKFGVKYEWSEGPYRSPSMGTVGKMQRAGIFLFFLRETKRDGTCEDNECKKTLL